MEIWKNIQRLCCFTSNVVHVQTTSGSKNASKDFPTRKPGWHVRSKHSLKNVTPPSDLVTEHCTVLLDLSWREALRRQRRPTGKNLRTISCTMIHRECGKGSRTLLTTKADCSHWCFTEWGAKKLLGPVWSQQDNYNSPSSPTQHKHPHTAGTWSEACVEVSKSKKGRWTRWSVQ